MAREKPTLPISAREMLQQETTDISKRISAASGDRIRIQNNRVFVTPDGNEGETLEGVVIEFVSSNMFYDSAFDRENPAPPACFAIGPEPATLAPSPNSPNKQSESCASCPNNAFGSAGKGKACKNTRLVGFIPASAFDDPDGEIPVWVLSVPPTSVTPFDKFVRGVLNKYRLPPTGVITQITLDNSAQYASPRFTAIRALEDSELEVIMPVRDLAIERLTAEPDVSGYTPPKPTARGRR
jgi:hypothetical protein